MVQLESLLETGDVQNYVSGEWTAADGTDRQDVLNPTTGERLAYVPFSSDSDIGEAVTAGQEAFETWGSQPVEERIQPLFRFDVTERFISTLCSCHSVQLLFA